tara:strand:+ start:2819 stop:3739 length:921 start_codon:yes stop_codon:yes gene_type:complete
MKVAFFSEMEFQGKILRTHENMRVEFAWMATLKADHYTLGVIPNVEYDIALVLNSKTKPNLLNVKKLKSKCKLVAILQEGPNWNFQDYSIQNQIHYYNNLVESDIIFTHNKIDKIYYKGLTNHPRVETLPSLMIHDPIKDLPQVDRSKVIIGGNFVSWYGGFDSYIVAQEMGEEIFCPSMGRKKEREEEIINHLPYMNWKEWMFSLNKFKYGIHLMRTHAAGTFALNCSYLGIPCIGYKGLDTQEILHPNLSIEIGDLISAKKLAQKLKNDLEFYQEQSILTKKLYKEKYHENIFNSTFKKQLKIS